MIQIFLRGLLVLTSLFCLQPGFSQNPVSADSIDNISKKVAASQLQSWATDGWSHPKYDWTNGAAYAGLLTLARESKDQTCFDFLPCSTRKSVSR